MSLYTASLLLTGVVGLLLSLFVYLSGKKQAPNQWLALCTLSVAVWSIGQSLGELSPGHDEVLFWTRINLGGAIFIPAFYLPFVLALLNKLKTHRRILQVNFLLALVFILSDLTPLFVAEVARRPSFRYYPVPGPFYYLFPLYFFLVVGYGLFKLFQAVKGSLGNRRNQLFYVILASLLGFGGGVTAFFPTFNINIPSLAYLLVPLYLLIVIYAILKHRLLDISVVIRRGLIYSILTLIIAALYVLLILFLGRAFQSLTGWNSILATAFFVFALVAVFEPLRAAIAAGVDHIFFRGKYDYQKTLKELSAAAVTIFDPEELERKVVGAIQATLKVDLVEISKEKEVSPAFELSLPMAAKGSVVGTLNLGPKLSGEGYTEEDIDLLTTLANQVAIARENANLYREILRADKLAALGTVAAGLAHEIKNPLASLKGMTQILPENLTDPGFVKNYVEMVPRQLDRINTIVETLMRIGKPQKYAMTGVNLSKILDDLFRLMENQARKKNIVFKKEWEPDLLVQGDAEQLMQVFMNLILNAIDAMPKGGTLIIKGVGEEGKGVRVEVGDTGVGIPADKLKNVFDPFFTTKEAGMGLGLAVTYRIIKEHNGEIEVKSRMGEGTTFKIWLSTRPRV
jgi:signal transduction histidine kinase